MKCSVDAVFQSCTSSDFKEIVQKIKIEKNKIWGKV